MKTSLVLDDSLFKAAQKEARRENKTLSEMISLWARLGWESLKKTRKKTKGSLRSVDLGGPAQIDINSRRDWMDELDR